MKILLTICLLISYVLGISQRVYNENHDTTRFRNLAQTITGGMWDASVRLHLYTVPRGTFADSCLDIDVNGLITKVPLTLTHGTVTSVATDATLTGGTITTTGTLKVDTSIIQTKNNASQTYATITNLALKVNISDTSGMLNPYLRKGDTVAMLLPYLRKGDTTAMLLPYLRKGDTTAMLNPYLRAAVAAATYAPISITGTVTSVATDNTMTGGTITSTGTLKVDTSKIATRNYAQQTFAPISITGTVTSVATGYGAAGGTITTTGTIRVDSSVIATKESTQTLTNKTILSPTLITPALGTPASGVLTNCTGTASGLTAGNVTTNANLTGDVTSVGNATTIAAASLTTVNNNTGGWVTYKATGSGDTTTSLTLVNSSSLTTGTLSVSSNYEFEAVIIATNSAGTAGIRFAINVTGTGSPTGYATYAGATSASAGAITSTNALNTADGTSFITTSAGTGFLTIKGIFGTGTGTPTFSIQFQKQTSGTATILAGSTLRVRKIA